MNFLPASLLALLGWSLVCSAPALASLNAKCSSLVALAAEYPQDFGIVEQLGRGLEADTEAAPAIHRLAEIIRARSEAQRAAASHAAGESVPLSEEESRLILRYEGDILEAIVPEALRELAQFRIRDGYLSEVTMSLADFVEKGERVFRAFPIRHLHITHRSSWRGTRLWQPFFASPLLAQLTSLSLGYVSIGTSVQHLLGCPHLSRLRHLHIAGGFSGLQRRSFARFLTEGNFPALHTLELVNNSAIGDEQISLLARATGFPSLRHLDVSHSSIYGLDLRNVTESPLFDRLVSLRMADCMIQSLRLPRVVGFFGNLRLLDLSGNRLRETDARELLLQDFVQRLTRLELRSTGLETTELWRHVQGIESRTR